MGIQVVLFNRDLRAADHAPLVAAARRGSVLPLFVIDPTWIQASDFDSRHWTFIRASLIDLRRKLTSMGAPLVVRFGTAPDVLTELSETHSFDRILMHETSEGIPGRLRHDAIKHWCREHKVKLSSLSPLSTKMPNLDHESWSTWWQRAIESDPLPEPEHLTAVHGVEPGPIPTHEDLGLPPDTTANAQFGGEIAARRTLNRFCEKGLFDYDAGISSLATLEHVTSRLSPYLTWGNLSARQVSHACREQFNAIADPIQRREQRGGLRRFEWRLEWRERAVLSFSRSPQIAVENINGERPVVLATAQTDLLLDAWCEGRTGYPLVDAAIACLSGTGWLSFRLRALLISFAVHDLKLHWRQPGLQLARWSMDYEPGIHWEQVQDQAGTAESDSFRIYNPTKQAIEQDPDGSFIRHWIPALEAVPTAYIHSPSLMPPDQQRVSDCLIGRDYPAPVVNHLAAVREERLLNRTSDHPENTRVRVAQRGSRPASDPAQQLSLLPDLNLDSES